MNELKRSRRKDEIVYYEWPLYPANTMQIRSAARRNEPLRRKPFPWKLLITFGLGALGILAVVILF